MATYLLNTNVIIDVLMAKRDRAQVLASLSKRHHSFACCSINVTEIYAGLRPQDEARTADFLESLEWYEVTWEIARRAGIFRREYSRKGITLSLADATIAAVAIVNHLTLMTDNIRHFPMEELSLYRFPAPN